MRSESGIAQGDGFIERGHAQPARSFFFEGPRTLHRAVAIGIRLYHRADSHSRPDVPLHHAEVVAQVFQRNFGPGGTRRGPFHNFDSSHCRRL